MGKTTFVKNLANAMGRDCETISLAGFKESGEYSILGDEKKPSLVAWAIKKNGLKKMLKFPPSNSSRKKIPESSSIPAD